MTLSSSFAFMENNKQQQLPPPPATGVPHPSQPPQVKLPSFWPENPTSWFCLAEGQFILRNMVQSINALTISVQSILK
jgi:hypothetical protein